MGPVSYAAMEIKEGARSIQKSGVNRMNLRNLILDIENICKIE
jgi:hypothetical protein